MVSQKAGFLRDGVSLLASSETLVFMVQVMCPCYCFRQLAKTDDDFLNTWDKKTAQLS